MKFSYRSEITERFIRQYPQADALAFACRDIGDAIMDQLRYHDRITTKRIPLIPDLPGKITRDLPIMEKTEIDCATIYEVDVDAIPASFVLVVAPGHGRFFCPPKIAKLVEAAVPGTVLQPPSKCDFSVEL